MSTCTFCMKLELTGNGGCKNVDNPSVIKFLCQKYNIDFYKAFGFEPLSHIPSLSIPLCSDCTKLFHQTEQIQTVLNEVKVQLNKILSGIRGNIILSPSGIFCGSKDSEIGMSRTCQILRREIIRSNVIGIPEPNVTVFDVRGDKNPLPVIVKRELNFDEGDVSIDYEDVEETKIFEASQVLTVEHFDGSFVDPSAFSKAVPVSSSKPGSSKSRFSSKTVNSTDQSILRNSISSAGASEVLSSSTSSIKCELCNTSKRFHGIFAFKIHLQDYHKSAKLIYPCSRSNCDKMFPVQALLTSHLQFHDDEKEFPYGCEMCDRRFAVVNTWKTHLEWHKRNVGPGRRECSCQCRFCTTKSYYPVKIRHHELKHHLERLIHACGSCDLKFSTSTILESHVQIHVNDLDGPYNCTICDAICDDANHLDDHLIRHHIPRDEWMKKSKTDTNCTICDRIFKTPYGLSNHIRKCHRSEPFECLLCPGKKFSTFSPLLTHVIKYHEEIQEKHLPCSQCPRKFATEIMLKRHTKNHKYDKTKPLFCEICEQRFSKDDLTGLDIHKQSRHESKLKESHYPHHCSITNCDKSFKSPSELRRHEHKNHPELFIYNCTLCDKSYSIEAFLETHVKTHNGNVSISDAPDAFRCTVCNLDFASANALEGHLLKHTGEQKVTCKICLRSFYYPMDLKLHMSREHGADEPFKCNICDKKFMSHTLLKNHKIKDGHFEGPQPLRRQRQRKGPSKYKPPRPRVCEICGKSVTSFSDHMRMHEGDKKHRCYFCDKGFVRPDALRTHLSIHTGEKGYICHICPAEFNQTHCLKGHLNNVHKKNGTYFPKPEDFDIKFEEDFDLPPSPQVEWFTNDDSDPDSKNELSSQVSLDFDALMD